MTTIDSSNNYCTLINVFTVAPEQSQELFDLLKAATETVINTLPGYVSANLHLSDDRKTVTNYAQWATPEDYQNALKNQDMLKHMKLAANAAIGFSPTTYTKIWTHSSED